MRKDKQNKEQILNEFEQSLTDGFAAYLDSIGGKPLMGRIWGLLSSKTEPVSLSEISRVLKVSKPAVSNSINQAVSLGILRKIYIPEFPRENFFLSETDTVDFMLKAAEMKTGQVLAILDKALAIIDESVIDDGIKKRYDKVMRTKRMFQIIKDEYLDFTGRVKQKLSENI